MPSVAPLPGMDPQREDELLQQIHNQLEPAAPELLSAAMGPGVKRTPTPPLPSELKALKESLLSLEACDDDTTAFDAFLATQSVQAYLDHYQINFSVEFPNIHHLFGRFSAQGFDLACHVWKPTHLNQGHTDTFKGMVWLQHGYTDHVGLCQHAIRWLLLQGYGVVCFDLPGHGLSSGYQASIQSFDQYRDVLDTSLKLAAGKLPKPWHALGQSTGCAVLLNLIASYPQAQYFDKVVLLAPLIRAKGWASMRWGFYAMRLFMHRLKRTFNASSHDQGFLDFLAFRDPLQTRHMPVEWLTAMDHWVGDFGDFSVQSRAITIVQGSDDQTVDHHYNIATIEQKFSHTQTHYIDGARHQLINESSEFREQVWAHVLQGLTD